MVAIRGVSLQIKGGIWISEMLITDMRPQFHPFGVFYTYELLIGQLLGPRQNFFSSFFALAFLAT